MRLCSLAVFTANWGGIYSDTGASRGGLAVPIKWWCPLTTVPGAAWCGVDGIPSAATGCKHLYRVASCVGASWLVLGHQAHIHPTQTVGTAHPWVITKYRGAPHLKPHREETQTASLWGCSRGWTHIARHRADTKANSPCWRSRGFHLSKTFPWASSSSPSCCRGLPPCQAQITEPHAARAAPSSTLGLSCRLRVKLRVSLALLIT